MTLTEQDPRTRIEADWVTWLAAIFPQYCTARFARHHVAFWDWVCALEPGTRPPASVNIWARGGAKSTSAEMAVCRVAAHRQRRYVLYVCETQDQADDHVAAIGEMLESDRVGLFYPELGQPLVNKQGHSRGWRHNRLTTASGFRVDGLGLDTSARGIKFGKDRPDLIVVDDVDGLHDTPEATTKKVRKLTHSILQAGADDLAVLAIQNLIIPDGIFAQLADGRAEFLRRREVTGPIPALENMTVERDEDGEPVVSGTPTWEGQSVEVCQAQVEDFGLTAFVIEAQHEVGDAPGALWCSEQIDAGRVAAAPEFADDDPVVVSVDPSGGAGKGHDDQGIIAVARHDGQGYVLADASCSLSAMGWGKAAVRLAVELGADWIEVEDDYGGDSMTNTVMQAAEALARDADEEDRERFKYFTYSANVRPRKAGQQSKKERAKPVSACYGEKDDPESWDWAKVHHVGHLPLLEREMTGWEPDVSTRSPNRIDSLVHGIRALGIMPARRGRRRSIVSSGRAA